MPRTLDPELRRALVARIRYYNEMGIYDFYRQPVCLLVGNAAAEYESPASAARIERTEMESTQSRGSGRACQRQRI